MTARISSLHCLLSYDNKLGGSVHAALNICKYLARDLQRVEVVAPFESKDDTNYLAESFPEVQCHKLARSFPRRFSNSRDLDLWVRENLHRFDIVEIHGVWFFSALRVARACKQLGKPYLVRPHGSLDPFDLQKHDFLKRCFGPMFLRPLLRNAAGVVCTAELESERLVSYGANPTRHVLPLPVPLSDKVGDGKSFRAKHKIPADAQVVLFLSRIDYKKGLNFLIPAIGKLKSEYPRLWFLIAGAGTSEFLKQVRDWIDACRISLFTSEVGFLTGREKIDALAAADIFALPSLNENFGIVNIEAMHAGLPLLISEEVYICREIVEAGAGIVCQNNEQSVIVKLREMLCGSIDLRNMGSNGRKLVQQRYRPESATAELAALYSKVLAAAD